MNKKQAKGLYIDSSLEGTVVAFDHHVYEVTLRADNAVKDDEKRTVMARNVVHLLDCLDSEKYPCAGRVKDIKEIAYVPYCNILINRERAVSTLSKKFKED